MDARESIEGAFRELISEKPYRKITISELCERANVSRTAFYGRFSDKEDVVAGMFEEQVIEPIRRVRKLIPAEDRRAMSRKTMRRMYDRVYEERDFYTKLVRSLGDEDILFQRVMTRAVHNLNVEGAIEAGVPHDDWRFDYTAYFFSSSLAMLMHKWMSDGMKVSPAEVAELHGDLIKDYWQGLREI